MRVYREAMRPILLCGVVVAVGSALLPATASATPSSDITAVTLTQGAIPAVLQPFVSGASGYVAREITIAPGGTTGWHYHDGPVVGVVRSGTLTHPGADCVPQIYSQGQLIAEPNGADKFHVGRNLGTTPVVLDVIYFVQDGKPLFEDAPAPAREH